MLNDYVISVIRTGATLAVGAVISWLVARGIGGTDSLTKPLYDFLVAGLTVGWYALARAGETFAHRYFGFLFVVPKPPGYTKPGEPAAPGPAATGREIP